MNRSKVVEIRKGSSFCVGYYIGDH